MLNRGAERHRRRLQALLEREEARAKAVNTLLGLGELLHGRTHEDNRLLNRVPRVPRGLKRRREAQRHRWLQKALLEREEARAKELDTILRLSGLLHGRIHADDSR